MQPKVTLQFESKSIIRLCKKSKIGRQSALTRQIVGTCSAQIKFAPLPHLRQAYPCWAALTPEILFIMAIIRSLAVGKATKSAGNVTYRTVRGRTIMSEKVVGGASTRADGGNNLRTFVFGLINRFMALHAADIAVSFNKTKYGSERNYFLKVNYAALSAALSPLYNGQTPDEVTDTQISDAITAYATENPSSIYRVKLAGSPIVYLNGAWSNAQNPVEAYNIQRLVLNGSNLVSGSNVYDDGVAFSENNTLIIYGSKLKNVTIKSVRTELEDGMQATTPFTAGTQSDSEIRGTFTLDSNDSTSPFKKVELISSSDAVVFTATIQRDSQLEDPLG